MKHQSMIKPENKVVCSHCGKTASKKSPNTRMYQLGDETRYYHLRCEEEANEETRVDRVKKRLAADRYFNF